MLEMVVHGRETNNFQNNDRNGKKGNTTTLNRAKILT